MVYGYTANSFKGRTLCTCIMKTSRFKHGSLCTTFQWMNRMKDLIMLFDNPLIHQQPEKLLSVKTVPVFSLVPFLFLGHSVLSIDLLVSVIMPSDWMKVCIAMRIVEAFLEFCLILYFSLLTHNKLSLNLC